jgi:hypothetical protein
MGGAPVRECGGVDVNTEHDVSIRLEPLLHFLGHLEPFFPARWHLVAIVEKLKQRWIIFIIDPIGPDWGRRLILGVRHTYSPCGCRLSLTRPRRVACLDPPSISDSIVDETISELKRFRYQSRALPNFRDILPAAQDCFSTRPPRLYQTVLTFHLTLAAAQSGPSRTG